MYSDKLITDLNFQDKIIDESKGPEAVDSHRMFDLLSETVLDRRTLGMIEIHELYRALNHTQTMVGGARLFHSLHSPPESLELIQAKQDSLWELDGNDRLRQAVEEYLGMFSRRETALFRFLNVHYQPMFPYSTLKEAVGAMDTLRTAVENIPQPETVYLDSLIKVIKNYGDASVSQLIKKPTFRTLGGIKIRKEKFFFTPALRFRPGRISGGSIWPALPSLFFATAGISGIMDVALAESLALLTGGGILLGFLYGFLIKPIFDNETAILSIRQRFLDSDHFSSTIEAVACIDELLSFCAFRKNMDHATVIPEITDDERHSFVAQDLKNPVVAMGNKNFVGNDINLDNIGLTFITGPNSGGKTTFCKTIVQSQILGQIGAPVVARSARMNIADKICYQAPAFDSLSDPEGRFGTELRRTREIFFTVTPKSLAILDEIAEGTTIHEKLPLSVAILNGFYAKVNNTILVTHSYELVELFRDIGRGQYFQVEFSGDKPTHRLIPGISYDSHAERVVRKIGLAPEDIQKHLEENGYI